MNSFQQCSDVETEGLKILMPYLTKQAYKGRVVPLFGNENVKELQQSGDVIIGLREDKCITFDLKIESKHTGNFFIELWSNKSRLTQGWLFSCKADRILYLFLDRPNDVYSIHTKNLKHWIFGVENNGRKSRLSEFAEVKQSKYDQLNDTWGLLVPILRLTHVGIAKHISLYPENMASA